LAFFKSEFEEFEASRLSFWTNNWNRIPVDF
jgi:hypothetical protein